MGRAGGAEEGGQAGEEGGVVSMQGLGGSHQGHMRVGGGGEEGGREGGEVGGGGHGNHPQTLGDKGVYPCLHFTFKWTNLNLSQILAWARHSRVLETLTLCLWWYVGCCERLGDCCRAFRFCQL